MIFMKESVATEMADPRDHEESRKNTLAGELPDLHERIASLARPRLVGTSSF